MRVRDGDDCLRCEYCQTVHRPDKSSDGVALLGQVSDLQCPLCAVPLEQALIGRHPTSYCTRCCGNLISMPVSVSLVEDLRAQQGGTSQIPHPPDPHGLQRRIHCPQCKQTMDTHYYCGPGNVIIDDCDRCELNWLDNGELMCIVRAPDHSLENTASW